MPSRTVLALVLAGLLIGAAVVGTAWGVSQKKSEKVAAKAQEEAAISPYCYSTNYNHQTGLLTERVRNYDYQATIKLSTPEDIAQRRIAVRAMMFGKTGPQYSIEDLGAAPCDNLWLLNGAQNGEEKLISAVANSYLLSVVMSYGMKSNIIRHIPKSGGHEAKPVIIFHKGHGSDYPKRFQPLADILKAGFEVYEIGMPLVKENKVKGMSYESPRYGLVEIRHHDDLWFMDMPDGNALRFFIEPVIAIVDRIKQQQSSRGIVMIGLSGGGWTTMVAAAIEPRIDSSIAVAGTWPEYLLTTGMRYPGDYEQINPDLYRIATRLELYVMAGYGSGRNHQHIFNMQDSCCFAGEGGLTYQSAIQQKLRQLGAGQFSAAVDYKADGHVIGNVALDVTFNSARQMAR